MFSSITKLFFSNQFYYEILEEKSSKTILWFVASSIFTSLIIYLIFINFIYDIADIHGSNFFIKEFPEIQIKEGIASSEVKQPYFIKSKNKRNNLFILDTNDELDIKNLSAPIVLVNKKNIHIKFINGTKTYEIKDLCEKIIGTQNFTINQKFLLEYLDIALKKFNIITLFIIFILFSIIATISNLIRVLFCSFFILMTLEVANKKLLYKQIIKTSMLAYIPANLINIIIVKNLDIFLSTQSILAISNIITIAYQIFAIRLVLEKQSRSIV